MKKNVHTASNVTLDPCPLPFIITLVHCNIFAIASDPEFPSSPSGTYSYLFRNLPHNSRFVMQAVLFLFYFGTW